MRSGAFGSRGAGGWLRRALKNPTAGGTTGGGYVLAPSNLGDGLLVGSDRLDSHPGGFPETRMFYDQATGAFRAGLLQGSTTAWDSTSRGVASVAMGRDCTASGTYSVALGQNSTASGQASVAIGLSCTASGSNSFAAGSSSAASQTGGVALWGGNSTSTGMALNGTSSSNGVSVGPNSVSSRNGQLAHGNGRFSADGDAQVSQFISRNSTTDGTATELFLDGSSARITLGTTRTMAFHIKLAAHRTDVSGTAAVWPQIFGGITRDSSGNVRLLGSVTGASTTTLADAGGTTWSVAVTADTSNQALIITVTGEAAKTVRWVAVTEMAEVG